MIMNQGNLAQPVFEIVDTALAETTPDLLGIWTAISLSQKEEAFSITSRQGVDGTIWRSRLPAESCLAHSYLLNGEAKLGLSQQALPVATDRLEAYLRQESSSLAFDYSSAGALLPPEAELSRALQELRSPTVQFGLGEQLFGTWEQGVQKFQVFVHRLLQAVAHYAWVETYEGEQLLSQTAVSWKGNIEAAWQENLNPAQVAIHQRTLALVLASRITLVHAFGLAARGAILLSSMLILPAGPLLILPAAWKFIDQVLEEYREHKATERHVSAWSPLATREE